MDIAATVNYKIEGGKDIPQEEVGNDLIEELFDLSNTDYHYFQSNFLNKEHLSFLCAESDRGPIALSIVRKDDGNYEALLRTADKNTKVQFSAADLKVPFFRRLFGLGPSSSSYIKAVSNTLPRQLKMVNDPQVPQGLLDFEDKQAIKGFKFGILYCGPGQVKEDEMFTNGTHKKNANLKIKISLFFRHR